MGEMVGSGARFCVNDKIRHLWWIYPKEYQGFPLMLAVFNVRTRFVLILA